MQSLTKRRDKIQNDNLKLKTKNYRSSTSIILNSKFKSQNSKLQLKT